MWWCSGSACIVDDGWFHGFFFISCPVECMNSYNIWICIYNESSMNSYIFLHFKYMNSYKYEFRICVNSYFFCSYHVWIHIFFAVQNKSCECTQAASTCRECAAQAASAQREPWGQSPSSSPAPTRPRPAAPTVRVACGSPDSKGCMQLSRYWGEHMAAPIVRVACSCPNS
jgi:hypothetical protein